MPTFRASRGSSALTEGPKAVLVTTAILRESQNVSRRWRNVRIMRAEANAAYSECGVELADNGSLGPTSETKMNLNQALRSAAASLVYILEGLHC